MLPCVEGVGLTAIALGAGGWGKRAEREECSGDDRRPCGAESAHELACGTKVIDLDRPETGRPGGEDTIMVYQTMIGNAPGRRQPISPHAVEPVFIMRSVRSVRLAGVLALLSIAAAATSGAQIEATYTKTEVRVPMRDGTQLFTVVYAPRDTTRRYPIMMTRTPYSVGPYGPDAYPRALGPSPRFSDEGFIFVYQD